MCNESGDALALKRLGISGLHRSGGRVPLSCSLLLGAGVGSSQSAGTDSIDTPLTFGQRNCSSKAPLGSQLLLKHLLAVLFCTPILAPGRAVPLLIVFSHPITQIAFWQYTDPNEDPLAIGFKRVDISDFHKNHAKVLEFPVDIDQQQTHAQAHIQLSTRERHDAPAAPTEEAAPAAAMVYSIPPPNPFSYPSPYIAYTSYVHTSHCSRHAELCCSMARTG